MRRRLSEERNALTNTSSFGVMGISPLKQFRKLKKGNGKTSPQGLMAQLPEPLLVSGETYWLAGSNSFSSMFAVRNLEEI